MMSLSFLDDVSALGGDCWGGSASASPSPPSPSSDPGMNTAMDEGAGAVAGGPVEAAAAAATGEEEGMNEDEDEEESEGAAEAATAAAAEVGRRRPNCSETTLTQRSAARQKSIQDTAMHKVTPYCKAIVVSTHRGWSWSRRFIFHFLCGKVVLGGSA